LPHITDFTVDSTVDFDLFALFNPVLSRDKSFVFASEAVGSQGNRSPSSRYQNAFVRCEAEESLPYVNTVSKKDRKL